MLVNARRHGTLSSYTFTVQKTYQHMNAKAFPATCTLFLHLTDLQNPEMDSDGSKKYSRRSQSEIEHRQTIISCHSYYEVAAKGMMFRHKVNEAALADRLFAAERYAECQQVCYDILHAQPSEAIQARCHMYLARGDMNPGYAAARA